MKVSYDLRFAHLPGGSWPYVSQVIWIMVREYPETQWRIYHNPWSRPQQEIIRYIQGQYPEETNSERIDFRPVRSGCLSLRQHIEFMGFQPGSRVFPDDASVYHYLHFDLPLGMRQIPLVVTIHDLYPLSLPGYCSAAKRAYFKFIAGYNARRAAKVIAVSQSTKNDIVKYLSISADKIAVIHQGYSREFRPIDDDQFLGRTRNKYHLPEKFILYTGNHKPHKNLDRLLQAFAGLPVGLQKLFPLVLTGPITAETQKLLVRAHRLGIKNRVSFLGLVAADDLPGLYNLASLVVHPSLYEGFGLAPLEAMACGTPAACSNAGAIPEVVGDACRLFDPNSIDDMTASLTAALENDVDNPAVRQSGLDRAENFSWENTARQTYQVYETVAYATGF